MNPAGFIGCILALRLLPRIALSKDSIQTRIIPGGEVSISEVKARYDGQSISVSGTGLEVFPRQTCGHPEIAFVDANGRGIHRCSPPIDGRMRAFLEPPVRSGLDNL
jgi:hypothetical protein